MNQIKSANPEAAGVTPRELSRAKLFLMIAQDQIRQGWKLFEKWAAGEMSDKALAFEAPACLEEIRSSICSAEDNLFKDPFHTFNPDRNPMASRVRQEEERAKARLET